MESKRIDLRQPAKRVRLLVFLMVTAAAALFVGANIHLVYVAVASQPECVAHAKAGEAGQGMFSAAKSAC
jgi:hypothetical protein